MLSIQSRPLYRGLASLLASDASKTPYGFKDAGRVHVLEGLLYATALQLTSLSWLSLPEIAS